MKVGIVMDPLHRINRAKDSSFAMLLAAKARGWELFYSTADDLLLRNGSLFAKLQRLEVFDRPQHWFKLDQRTHTPITELDFILFRQDPPFNMEYIYTSYLLEHAEKQHVPVFNRPAGIRDVNEKCFITHFSDCITDTQICRRATAIKAFAADHKELIIKPLDGMGGTSIFKTHHKDKNLNVIIETLTANESRYVMVQRYIPEISHGDKRILLVDGVPIPYALARLPAEDEFRGNLVKGGKGKGVALTERDYYICDRVGPVLKEKGLIFAGLDVIGHYLTEINVTSPTCIRELDRLYGLNIADQLMDSIAARLALPRP